MLFAICADRGAPGSTTTALALAAARGLPAVVVEADPYGGDLALRVRADGKRPLPATPTVLSVAAGRSSQQAAEPRPAGMPQNLPADRRHRDLWRDGAHQLNDLVRVVPGFMAAEQGTSMAWPVLASALESQSVPIFADLGRIHTGSPSMPIATVADALIIVCRGDMASVQHMVERLELLVPAIAERNGRPPVVMPLVVAPRQHGAKAANSVVEILGETSVGPALRGVSWLAWDSAAVNLLENGADPWAKPLKKSPLMRSAQKAMWMLGLATGLEHTEPVASKRGGARRSDQPTAQSGHGGVWPGKDAEPSASAPEASLPAQDVPPRPTPPPTWRPRDAGEQPRNGTRLTGGPDAGQHATADPRRGVEAGPHWETAAREERH